MGLFDKLESKLEQGVNGAFARAFKAEVQPVEIASGIRRAMDDRASSMKKGQRPVVPNLFTIELSPTDYQRLSSWGDELDDELIASAQEHCDEQRYLPGGPLTIVLAEEDELETGVFRLRPATAKAADALAHSRSHPRPQTAGDTNDRVESAPRPTSSSTRPAAAQEHADGATAVSAASRDTHAPASREAQTTQGAPLAQRPLGDRIKAYLMGESAHDHTADAEHPAPRTHGTHGPSADDAPYDEDLGVYDNDPRHHPHPRDEAVEYDVPGESDAPTDDGFDDYAGTAATQARPVQPARPARPATVERGDHVAAPMPAPRTPRRAPAPATAADRTFVPREHEHDDDGEATAQFIPTPPSAATRPRGVSPRQRPWLKIDGQRYPLLGAITTLGRDDDADIVIDDPGVSRAHSEVRITHDGPHLVMSVRDLGSTNGTFVNGDRIESQHVRDGDRITVGRTHMTIHLGDRT